MTRPTRWRSWTIALAMLTALLAPLLQSGSADAAGSIGFVAASHSDPTSQKFKQAVVSSQAQAGDTLVLVFTRATTVSWTGPTGVTGWTQVDTFGNGTLTSTVYSKTVASGDPGATVRFDTANYAKALLTVAVYRGVDTATPLTTAHGSDAAATTAHPSPTATAASGDTVASYWVDRSDTTVSWAAPAGTAERDNVIGTGTYRYSGLLADSGGPVSAGNYGGLLASSSPSTRAMMWTIVLPAGGAPPVNQPPTAAFTSSCSGLTCTFSSGSFDTDGSIAFYLWNFADGQTDTTPSPTHSYAAQGSYDVTLAVTDDAGASSSVTHTVVVSEAPPASIAFVGASHTDPAWAKFKTAVVPSGSAAGDTALMTFTRASTVTWTGPTGVTGWTQLGSSTANALTSTVWEKTLTAGDIGGAVRFDTGASAKAMLTMAVYSAVSGTNPVRATFSSDATATTTHLTPTVTASAGDWVASTWIDKADTTTSWTASGVTMRDVALGTGTGRYNALLADSGGPVQAGSNGGKTAVTNAASRALMWSILLPAGGATPPSPVTKLMVIMEENETTSAYDGMPYLRGLSTTYGKATAFRGLVHPSLGNYLAIVSGQGTSTCSLNDPLPAACPQPGGTVFGQALGAGKTAKTYAESMATNCKGTNSSPYAARHNPWVYFPNEASSCSALDVPLGTTSSGALATDIDAGTLPNASMVVPNLINDAHDGTLQQADDWLALWMPRLMAGSDYQAGRLAIVVTFDEGVGVNQNIPFVLVHPSVSQVVVSQSYTHYGLARMYDDVLGTAPLNAAAGEPGLKEAFGL